MQLNRLATLLAERLQPYSQWLITAGAAILGTCFAYGLVRAPEMMIIAIGGLIILAIVFKYPEWTLISVIPLVLVEGALRKWFLPQLQSVLYFVKDGLLLLLFLHWLLSQTVSRRPAPARTLPPYLLATLFLFIVYFALQVFNPQMPGLTFYLFGIRTYLLPLVVLLVLPNYITWSQYERGLRWTLLAVVPLGLLGIVQSLVGPSHWLNKYVWGDMPVAVYGELGSSLVRVTSTFSFISGFGAYLTVVGLLAAFAFRDYISRNQHVLALVLGFAITSALLTGSRFRLFVVLVGIPITFLPHVPGLLTRNSVRFVLAVILAAMAFVFTMQEPIEQFAARVQNTRDVERRISLLWRTPIAALETGGIFGRGPATAHQSRVRLMQQTSSYGNLPATPEGEMPRVIVELGAIGGLLWYVFRALLMIYMGARFVDGLRRRSLSEQTFFGGLFVLSAFLYFGNLIYNSTQYYLYVFLLAGMRLIPSDDRTT